MFFYKVMEKALRGGNCTPCESNMQAKSPEGRGGGGCGGG